MSAPRGLEQPRAILASGRVIGLMLLAEAPFLALGPWALWSLVAPLDAHAHRALVLTAALQITKSSVAALGLWLYLRPVERWRLGATGNDQIIVANLRAQRAPYVWGTAWALWWGAALIVQGLATVRPDTWREAGAILLLGCAGFGAALPYLVSLVALLLRRATTALSFEAMRLGVSDRRTRRSLSQVLQVLALCLAGAPTAWMTGLALIPDVTLETVGIFGVTAVLWALLCARFVAAVLGDAFGVVIGHVDDVGARGTLSQLGAGPAVAITELQRLADGIGRMLARLKESEDALKSSLEESEEHYKAAVAAVGVRDDFLSIAGHELRTPLTALQLQLQSLERLQSLTPEVIATRLARAAQSGSRLARLIDELLDVARIQAGRMNLATERVELGRLARGVLEQMADEAERAGCRLTLTCDVEVFGMWDRGRLEQVVENLLSNAFKYGRGCDVELTVTAQPGRAILHVRDHGGGIATDQQARIFEKFERAVSASERVGGLGLGLWIVRQIVEAHGGSIRVDSQVGAGATFEVELPVRPGDPQGSP